MELLSDSSGLLLGSLCLDNELLLLITEALSSDSSSSLMDLGFDVELLLTMELPSLSSTLLSGSLISSSRGCCFSWTSAAGFGGSSAIFGADGGGGARLFLMADEIDSVDVELTFCRLEMAEVLDKLLTD